MDSATQPPEARTNQTDWIADAFEASSAASILFDDQGRCVVANARYLRLFHGAETAHLEGRTVEEVAALLAEAGHAAFYAGLGTADLAARAVTAIRGFKRDFEVPMTDGRVLAGSCEPTSRGGYLVSFRDQGRERLGEVQSMALLADALQKAQIGMILWGSSLHVQAVNDAWCTTLAPVEPGGSFREHAIGLVESGFFEPPQGMTAGSYVDVMIARSFSESMRVEGPGRKGRRVRLTSFPTPSGGVLGTAVDVTELRTAEVRARELLEEAVESLAEGVALYDADLRLRMSNSALNRLAYGDHPPMAYGTHMSEHCACVVELGTIAVPDGLGIDDFAEGLMQATRSHATGIPVPRTDGSVLELSSYPTTMGGYLVTLRDVTARKHAEAADARVRTIVESLGEGVALYDADMRMQLNNPAFRRLVMNDLPLTEPGTHVLQEVRNCISAGTLPVPEGGVEAVCAWIYDCVSNHRVGVELPLANGRTLEASNFATPDGGHLISMREITERKQAEQATREVDALVRAMVDASPATFLVSRLEDGQVLYAPPVSREIFGEAQTTHAFFEDPAEREPFLDALLPTGSVTDWPVRFRDRRDGSLRDGRISARVIEFRGQRMIVSSTRDVTEELAMRAELERQREVAHQTEKLSAMGELLAGVAHELNNPLSVVVGYAMMLQGRIDDPVLSGRVREISLAAERCARIVKTFLAMARQRPAEIAPVSVNELVEIATEVAGHGLRSAGSALELDLAPDLPCVAVDADQMAQVFANLVSNAEHALQGRPDGRLLVTTRLERVHGRVLAEFRDNGAGIDPAILSRVFEPFFTTKDVGLGTGMGLAYCHRIVTAHGGGIDVRSGHEGTCIAISLLTAECAPAAASEPAGGPSRDGRVLIVDDDRKVAGLLSDILREAGWDVTAVARGDAALAACGAHRFDAILCDVRMPGMDGPAVYRALKDIAPEQARRLAFLTGDALSPGADAKLKRIGRPVLEKPATPEAILSLVAQLGEGTA